MRDSTKKTLRFFLKHIWRYKWIAIIMGATLALGVSAEMVTPLFYKDFFNIITEKSPGNDLVQQLVMVIIYIVIFDFIAWIGWRISHFCNNFFQPRIMANIANECFEYTQGHSYNFFNSNFSGAIVKKINRMSRAFEGLMDRLYWELVPLILKTVIVLGVLTYLNKYLGLVLFVWGAFFIGVNYFVSLYKLKFDLQKAEADTKVTAALADTITNSINVKLFASLKFEMKNFMATTETWFRKIKKSWDISAVIESVQAFLMIGINGLILYIALLLWEQGQLTVGDFVLIQTYLMAVFDQLWIVGRIIRNIYENLADAQEMIVVLDNPHEVRNKKGAKKLALKKGVVEFKDVNFSYGRKDPVIKDLSFKVMSGEKIALIGPSGGGKSTVVKLLLRLFDIENGKILIDGQDISKVTQDSLRSNISLVPQEPILFHRTIMENIRYGKRDATDAEVIRAAKLAHCHEFIMGFPEAYDTFVGERGVKLSGGERQRVAIARAILANTKILVLDEATSSLDSESERYIQEALGTLMKKKTAFIIAHRLSTIMSVDRVFVVKGGKIIEEGNHESLLKKQGSLYKRLWELQSGGYLKAKEKLL